MKSGMQRCLVRRVESEESTRSHEMQRMRAKEQRYGMATQRVPERWKGTR